MATWGNLKVTVCGGMEVNGGGSVIHILRRTGYQYKYFTKLKRKFQAPVIV